MSPRLQAGLQRTFSQILKTTLDTANVKFFIKPPELKIQVCTSITSWQFDLKSIVLESEAKL